MMERTSALQIDENKKILRNPGGLAPPAPRRL
jgi:hypothetical protein